MPTKKNPYKTNRGFLPNPMNALYQEDIELSDTPAIQELVQLAHDLEKEIAGGFDLDYLIFEIFNNQLAFVKIGLIAFKIKSLKLYEGVCHSFKHFCEEKLGYSVWYINRLIRSSKIVMDLVAANFQVLPKCELQCRELRACCETEEELVQAWQSVVNNIEPHKITAKSIRAHLKPEEEKEEPETEKIEVSHELFETIFTAAKNARLSIRQLLEEIFQPKTNCDNWHSDKKIEKWQSDLENLVNEQGNTT